MQAKEIRQWTDEEIRVRLEEAYRELFNLRQEWYMGRLEDHNRITAVKRDIARMKTILRERELAREMQKQQGGAQ
ncbi:MAG TPA: 50S ribosomal protein L29 [Chloroflexi bacterium]|nr:50S ribosomal protein L29 [Chloroflexota bacterium]